MNKNTSLLLGFYEKYVRHAWWYASLYFHAKFRWLKGGIIKSILWLYLFHNSKWMADWIRRLDEERDPDKYGNTYNKREYGNTDI